MPMRIQPTSLTDVLLVEPELFKDERGHFLESFHLQQFHALSRAAASFVQDIDSRSMHGVRLGPAQLPSDNG
jgi:dTDP-4-dehydrorhamnose 3,5-epimerase